MRTAKLLLILSLSVICLFWACSDNGHPEGIGNYCETDDDCPTNDCYLGPGIIEDLP